eukprot:6460633-Amphidinium_carterae.2
MAVSSRTTTHAGTTSLAAGTAYFRSFRSGHAAYHRAADHQGLQDARPQVHGDLAMCPSSDI